jgi:hypothetical protein
MSDQRCQAGSYTKVGRLAPDVVHDAIRIIVDDAGEVGITRQELGELVCRGEVGFSDEPDSAAVHVLGDTGAVIFRGDHSVVLLVGNQEYKAILSQVKNMLVKWPHKKAALFRVD